MKSWKGVFLYLVLLASKCSGRKLAKRHGNERHGCDDGEHGIEIDLHGESDWKCLENEKWNVQSLYQVDKQCYREEPAYHVCIDKTIDNLYKAEIPHSGPHRKVWAKYGEYDYLPPGRYVHNLEHGGVVFMYHPCAPKAMVEKLRSVATTCLYRYILTAFPKLDKEYPFAVLTYGCVFRMSRVKPLKIRQWIRNQFGKSPESDVYGNGQYTYGLLVASPERESGNYNGGSETFCPDIPEDEEETGPTELDVAESEFKTDGIIPMQENITPEEEGFIAEVPVHLTTTTSTTKSTSKTVSTQLLPHNVDNSKEVSQITEAAIDTESTVYFWIVISFVCFIIGLLLGLCVLHCRARGSDKVKKLRVWSDKNSPDSFSIAAVVRKIPDSFTANRSQNDNYHRLEAEEQSSDEDNTV